MNTPAEFVAQIQDALETILGIITDAGLPATRDPGSFQPPGAIVTAPTITGAATMQTYGLTVPVWIVTDQPPSADSMDWMLGWVAVLLPLFGETAAEPTPWISPLNPAGLQAFLITVHVNVASI